jgi:hypothetical protein
MTAANRMELRYMFEEGEHDQEAIKNRSGSCNGSIARSFPRVVLSHTCYIADCANRTYWRCRTVLARV